MINPGSTPQPVYLPQPLAAEIIAHAREGTPEEICGVLRGRGMHALEVVRGQNIADERIENYTVDPQTLLRQFDFEDDGEEMMGIYHSHPVSEAYPSATDAWNAHYPDSVYFICSLEDEDAPVIRAYRMVTTFLGPESQNAIQLLSFYETRPGLFAYYQPLEDALAPEIISIVGELSRPFYIVYYAPSDSDQETEIRAVSIVEYPVVSE